MVRNRYSDLDSCIDDYTAWYVGNRDRMGSLSDVGVNNQLKFLNKAVDGALFIMHLMRQELRKAQTVDLPGQGVWVPTSFK